MSKTTRSICDSTTSKAVIVAPAPVITAVASATGFESGFPSTRIVIPYPGEVFAITPLRKVDRQHLQDPELCIRAHLIFHQVRRLRLLLEL